MRTFRPEGVDATPRVVRPRHSFRAATLRIPAFCGRSRLGSSVSCRSRAIPLVRKAACNLDQCRDPRKRACWQYCSPSGISSYSTSSSSLERSLSKGLRLLHSALWIDGSAAWACLAGDRDAKSWVVLEMLRDQPGQLNRLLSIFAKCAFLLQSSALLIIAERTVQLALHVIRHDRRHRVNMTHIESKLKSFAREGPRRADAIAPIYRLSSKPAVACRARISY